MYYSLFFHSCIIEEYLSCFQCLAVVNKAAINISMQDFLWT